MNTDKKAGLRRHFLQEATEATEAQFFGSGAAIPFNHGFQMQTARKRGRAKAQRREDAKGGTNQENQLHAPNGEFGGEVPGWLFQTLALRLCVFASNLNGLA